MQSSAPVTAVLAPSFPEETTPIETKTFNEKDESSRSSVTTRRSYAAEDQRTRCYRNKTIAATGYHRLLAEKILRNSARGDGPERNRHWAQVEITSESGGIDIGGATGSPPAGKETTAGRAGSAVNSEVSVGTGSGQHQYNRLQGCPRNKAWRRQAFQPSRSHAPS